MRHPYKVTGSSAADEEFRAASRGVATWPSDKPHGHVAVADTKRVREHLAWFVLWELVGVAICGFAGFEMVPEGASRLTEGALPAVGLVIGGLASLALVFLWNLLWAATRQRNEAWVQLDQRESDERRRESVASAIRALTPFVRRGATAARRRSRAASDLISLDGPPSAALIAAEESWRQWIEDARVAILEHCPHLAGEFENVEIGMGNDYNCEANSRIGRLAEILRQLRLDLNR